MSIHSLSLEISFLISVGIGLVSFRFVRFSSLRFVSILVLVSSRIIHLVSLVRSITRSLVRTFVFDSHSFRSINPIPDRGSRN